eukprot:gene7125-11288_t
MTDLETKFDKVIKKLDTFTVEIDNICENLQNILDLSKTPIIIEKYSNGSSYFGESDGQNRDGLGRYVYSSGAIYTGEWDQGLRKGIGRCTFLSGNSYDGFWERGMRNGLGSFYYSRNHDFYNGFFHDDDRDGFGIYWFSNSTIYFGDWENNRRKGKGIMVFQNGKWFGDWKNNMRDGIGYTFNFDGTLSHAGFWKENKKNGFGFYYKDSDFIYGNFENGVILKEFVKLHNLKECLVEKLNEHSDILKDVKIICQ